MNATSFHSQGLFHRDFETSKRILPAVQAPATAVTITRHEPLRIGIVFVGLGKAPPALQYLLVHTNTIQSAFEFELLPLPHGASRAHIAKLESNNIIARASFRDALPEFKVAYKQWLDAESRRFGLVEGSPDHFIILSRATFDDKYYTARKGGVSVLALGAWHREMTPPTLTEFFLTLVAREAVAMTCEPLSSSVHLGSKGCLCDFTRDLSEVRLKALNRFLCNFCRTKLSEAGRADVTTAAEKIASKDWMGTADAANTPAAISSKLGLELFVTKDLETTPWERFKSVIQEEGVRTAFTLIAGVLTGVLLARFGL